MAKRTTHRSTAGKKLYAVRDTEGQFKDIQAYARAHRTDLGKTSTDETRARAAKAAKAAAAPKAPPATKATGTTRATKAAPKTTATRATKKR